MSEKNESWDELTREGALDGHGHVLIDWEEMDAELPADRVLADLLGWERIYEDDFGNPYGLCGLVEKDGKTLAVFSFTQSPSIGHNYSYRRGMTLIPEQVAGVREWADAHLATQAAAKALAARRAALLKEHGLDEASVQARREALLREYGLL